jgi:hypothetical protein
MYSAQKIKKFISENISLQRNDTISIYDGPKGLTYTRGSMDYRNEDYTLILVFRTMDKIPTGKLLLKSVQFQLKNQ